MANNKYYAVLEHKISNRTIERAYENTPHANADGTIDYYKDMIDQYVSLAGVIVNSLEEAEEKFEKLYPTIWEEDETKISLQDYKPVI